MSFLYTSNGIFTRHGSHPRVRLLEPLLMPRVLHYSTADKRGLNQIEGNKYQLPLVRATLLLSPSTSFLRYCYVFLSLSLVAQRSLPIRCTCFCAKFDRLIVTGRHWSKQNSPRRRGSAIIQRDNGLIYAAIDRESADN